MYYAQKIIEKKLGVTLLCALKAISLRKEWKRVIMSEVYLLYAVFRVNVFKKIRFPFAFCVCNRLVCSFLLKMYKVKYRKILIFLQDHILIVFFWLTFELRLSKRKISTSSRSRYCAMLIGSFFCFVSLKSSCFQRE